MCACAASRSAPAAGTVVIAQRAGGAEPTAVHGLPLTTFLVAAYFRSVPRELFESSTLDGAGIRRSFLSIGLPMVRNGLLTVALLMFFSTYNDLLIALTFITSKDMSTVQVGLLNVQGEYGSVLYGPLFAGIIMQGLAGGALKG